MENVPAGTENDPNNPWTEDKENTCGYCGESCVKKYCDKNCEKAAIND